MANQEITTDQKADLLFKEFNGVADTWHAGNYAQQLYKFSDKVLGDNILTDTIPVTLPAGYDVASLDSLGFNGNPTPWANGHVEPIPGYPQLEFVFRLELYPVIQSQELTYSAPPGFCNVAGGGGVPSELANAVPFLFDAVNGGYNSIVFTKNPNIANSPLIPLPRDPQNQGGPGFKPYIFDTKNGFVTFYAEADPNEAEQINLNTTRNDFVKFINEYDRRRGKSFKKVFPELEEFYESCL